MEALGLSFEQLVGELLDEAGISPKVALLRKLKRLWKSDADVHQVLHTEYRLVGTEKASRTDRLAEIAALPGPNPKVEVAQALLRAVLYRNDGLHNSMSLWSDADLYDATLAFLTALMLCRKHTLVNPPMA